MSSVRFRVEEGHALAFTRAIGARPPATGDHVPPTFLACSAQQDPSHMVEGRPAGLMAQILASGGTVMHASQHFEYLGPVRIGQSVTVTERAGNTWHKVGGDGSALEFVEIIKEYANQVGDVLVRSRMVLVRR